MGNKELTNPKMKTAFKHFEKQRLKHQDQNITYAVCHMKGWRAFMEDTIIHINHFPNHNQYLFGVFDGHGGPEVAEYVKVHFSLQLYVNNKFKEKHYEEALIETFNKMDFLMQTQLGKKEILEITRHEIKIRNRRAIIRDDEFAGCTANVCYISQNEVIVANAGDARCVSYFNGRTMPLSYDHKPKDKTQLKRIKKAGGYVSGGRVKETLNVSRALGDFQYKNNQGFRARQQMITSTPDILKCKRKGLEFIIMGCDGIWQSLSNQEMTALINYKLQKQVPVDQILDELLDDLLAEDQEQYNGTDNMSAILIVFKNPHEAPKENTMKGVNHSPPKEPKIQSKALFSLSPKQFSLSPKEQNLSLKQFQPSPKQQIFQQLKLQPMKYSIEQDLKQSTQQYEIKSYSQYNIQEAPQ